jgi:hypothetical protein
VQTPEQRRSSPCVLNTTKVFDAETATEGLFVGVQNAPNILANDRPQESIRSMPRSRSRSSYPGGGLCSRKRDLGFIARLPVRSEAQRNVIREEVEKQLPGETQGQSRPPSHGKSS